MNTSQKREHKEDQTNYVSSLRFGDNDSCPDTVSVGLGTLIHSGLMKGRCVRPRPGCHYLARPPFPDSPADIPTVCLSKRPVDSQQKV